MNFKPFYQFILLFLAGVLMSCQLLPAALRGDAKKTTTIYVVRHAEKLTNDPAEKDPALSPEGEQRVQALAKYLEKEKIAAVFSTNYKRTRSTVQPLAEKYKLTVQTYDPKDNAALKNQVLQNFTGKTVVIAGHSNTILDIVEAFGAEKPATEVPDSKYDHIFKVTIDAKGTATVDAATYGAATN